MNDEEWRVRVDLAAAYRLVAHFGWDDVIFTHISARVPGPEHHFLINPYGMLFTEITPDNLVKIDLDGKIVEPTEHVVNPAGFTIHSAIHAARSNAQCVMHLHTVTGVAVSCQEHGLLPIDQTAMLLNGEVAYHEYEGIALELDERPRLVADLGSKRAMILRNHGTLTVGESVGDAFMTMYWLERACAMQIAMLAGGTPLHWPASSVQDVVRAQAQAAGRAAVVRMAWAALRRRIEFS